VRRYFNGSSVRAVLAERFSVCAIIFRASGFRNCRGVRNADFAGLIKRFSTQS
jgi:hypothetical protein